MPDESNSSEDIKNNEPTDISSNQEVASEVIQPVESVPVAEQVAKTPMVSVLPDPAIAPKNTGFVKKLEPKEKKIFVGLAALVAALIISGLTSAFFVWYQNPERVVADAILQAASAKTSVYEMNADYSSKSSDLGLKIASTIKIADSKYSLDNEFNISMADSKYKFGLGYVLADDVNYVKASGLDDTLSSFLSDNSVTLSDSDNGIIDDIIGKVENKWIKIEANDLNDYVDGASKIQTCVTGEINKLKTDKKQIKEIAKIYRENPVFVVDKELGKKDGSFGYVVKPNEKNTDNFVKNFKDTNFYKALTDCDDSIAIDSSDITDESDTLSDQGKIEFWVNTLSHKLTKVVMTSNDDESKLTITINVKLNTKVDIAVPKSDLKMDDVKSYITEISQVYANNFASSYDSTDYSSDSYSSDYSTDTFDYSGITTYDGVTVSDYNN